MQGQPRAYLASLLINNERTSAKLTDQEIYDKFTAKYGRTGYMNKPGDVQRQRRALNLGINGFKKFGTAASVNRPICWMYSHSNHSYERIPGTDIAQGAKPTKVDGSPSLGEDDEETPTPIDPIQPSPREMEEEEAPRKPAPATVTSVPVDWTRVRRIAQEESTIVSDSLTIRMDTLRSSIPSEDRIRQIVRDSKPPEIHVKVGEQPAIVFKSGSVHRKFPEILKKVSCGIPVLMVGPAGAGKTRLASQVAQALGRTFSFDSLSEGTKEYEILGRTLPDHNGSWSYRPSPFVKSYRDGGIHLFDEIDASDPNMLVKLNAAIANGVLSIPFADGDEQMVTRHADSVIIAAANTFGNGANRQYVGRNALDAATLNRFTMGTVEIGYDRDLEVMICEAICGNSARELTQAFWKIRDQIEKNRLLRICSTRNLEDSAKLIARGGYKVAECREMFLAGWTDEEKAKVA